MNTEQNTSVHLIPELKKKIDKYFKEYHIKDCLVILPSNFEIPSQDIDGQLYQLTNLDGNTNFIIHHVSSNPSIEGLQINLSPYQQQAPANPDNSDIKPPLLPQDDNKDNLHELIGDYLSRLAILVEKTTSKDPKPAAIWKHRHFLSSISHQIKTPLNAIFSGSKLIKHYINDDRIDRICEYMNQSCVELTRYMNDIIDFYYLKQDTLVLENTQILIADIINYVYENYKLQMQDAGISFNADIAADITQISCDERRLTQILMNLVNNAVKFTNHPESDENESSGENKTNHICIRVARASDTNKNIIIQVADTGVGHINLDDQEIYFQPFNQTTRNWLCAPDGIGLGLCLSRDFARKMGGDLRFIAPPMQLLITADTPVNINKYNTCIELVLPISLISKPCQPPELQVSFTETLKSDLSSSSLSVPKHVAKNPVLKEPSIYSRSIDNLEQQVQVNQIILIDDNQTNLELLTLILQQLGCDIAQIHTFTNSLDGQNYIIQNAGAISHAIIDIRMPRKNGLELINELAPLYCSIHFILLTALNYDDVRIQYSQIQSNNPRTQISLLFKPIDCQELNQLIVKPAITNHTTPSRKISSV